MEAIRDLIGSVSAISCCFVVKFDFEEEATVAFSQRLTMIHEVTRNIHEVIAAK